MTVVDFVVFQEKQKLVRELKEWRERLNLAYEFDWKDPSKQICHSEVERLRKLVEIDETIIDKISKHV